MAGFYSGEIEKDFRKLKLEDAFKYGSKTCFTIGSFDIVGENEEFSFALFNTSEEPFVFSLNFQLKVKPKPYTYHIDPVTGVCKPTGKPVPFADKGDSGAPVFIRRAGELVLVGILVGANKKGDAFVTMFKDILEALDIDEIEHFIPFKIQSPERISSQSSASAFSVCELKRGAQKRNRNPTKDINENEPQQNIICTKGTQIENANNTPQWKCIMSKPLDNDNVNSSSINPITAIKTKKAIENNQIYSPVNKYCGEENEIITVVAGDDYNCNSVSAVHDTNEHSLKKTTDINSLDKRQNGEQYVQKEQIPLLGTESIANGIGNHHCTIPTPLNCENKRSDRVCRGHVSYTGIQSDVKLQVPGKLSIFRNRKTCTIL